MNKTNKLNPVDLDFLDNVDGNAYAIMGTWSRFACKAGYKSADIKKVLDKATAGDYDHLLRTIMATGN